MELKLSYEEVQEIVKQHIEKEFGRIVADVSESVYGVGLSIILGEKKEAEPVKLNVNSNYPWVSTTHASSLPTTLIRGGEIRVDAPTPAMPFVEPKKHKTEEWEHDTSGQLFKPKTK